MSLPPEQVQIKRKRTDDPVEFLRVHESTTKKQRRATDFVFSRLPDFEARTDAQVPQPASVGPRHIGQPQRATSSQPPSTEPSQAATDTSLSNQFLDDAKGRENAAASESTNAAASQHATAATDIVQDTQVLQPRRFHISRKSTTSTAPNPALSTGVLQRSNRRTPTVFVERRVRKQRYRGSESRPQSQDGDSQRNNDMGNGETGSKARKRPGIAARTPATAAKEQVQSKVATSNLSTEPARNVRLPSGLVMPWDVNSQQLAAEMQAYTLQEISRTIAESDATQPGNHLQTSSSRAKKPSKFKPKKPALRYHERHPEVAMQPNSGDDMEIDESPSDDDMEDDAEYIIDTYIRKPAEDFDASQPLQNIGLLVLDSQPDIDEFYREDWSSDEEDEGGDEDENAEDHYTADYPEDEVDSDDEYDRNAYHYRTHNASDLEEFDEHDATYSDGEIKITKHPWMR